MFPHHGKHSGWIEVVCGPMFSGKTEELIRRLKLAQIAKQRVQIFKAAIDNRYAEDYIISHNDQRFVCQGVATSAEIMGSIQDSTRVIGIDEAQFMNDDIVDVCTKLADRGLRMIIAGLDQDYLGRPFGPMPKLLALAELTLKLTAVCMACGGMATKTQRLVSDGATVIVGSGEIYEARCRACFDPDFQVERAKPAITVSKQIQEQKAVN